MKTQKGERHRLTTLQRQIMQWLFLAGGGALPLDQLFNALTEHTNTPHTSPEVTAERLCEAVEQLLLMDYAEVRDDGRPRHERLDALRRALCEREADGIGPPGARAEGIPR